MVHRQLLAASHTFNGISHGLKVRVNLVSRKFVALFEQSQVMDAMFGQDCFEKLKGVHGTPH